MEVCTRDWLQETFLMHQKSFNEMFFDYKVIHNEDGTFTFYVHSHHGENYKYTVKREEL